MGITGLYFSVFSSVIKSVFPGSSIQLIFLFLITISALYFNTISARKYFSSMMILRYFVSRFDIFSVFFLISKNRFSFLFKLICLSSFRFSVFNIFKYHSRPSYQKSLRLSLTLYLPLSLSLSRSLHLMMFVISSSSFLSLSLLSLIYSSFFFYLAIKRRKKAVL